MAKTDNLDNVLAETTATTIATVGGMVLGDKIGSPELGAYIGSVLTPALTFMAGLLTPKQLKRIDLLMDLAQKKIHTSLEKGLKIRKDLDKDALQELSEGSLIAARDSYEERKIPLLANLVANAPFSDLPTENLMSILNTSESLSYRQICILAVIGKNMLINRTGLIKAEIRHFYIQGDDHVVNGVFHDVMILHGQGLIMQTANGKDPHKRDSLLAIGNIVPNRLKLSYLGAHIFNLLELGKVKEKEFTLVARILDGTYQNK